MEEYGEPGKIQVTERFKSTVESQKSKVGQGSLLEKFNFEERGEIDIKGKGIIRTWFLEENH